MVSHFHFFILSEREFHLKCIKVEVCVHIHSAVSDNKKVWWSWWGVALLRAIIICVQFISFLVIAAIILYNMYIPQSWITYTISEEEKGRFILSESMLECSASYLMLIKWSRMMGTFIWNLLKVLLAGVWRAVASLAECNSDFQIFGFWISGFLNSWISEFLGRRFCWRVFDVQLQFSLPWNKWGKHEVGGHSF